MIAVAAETNVGKIFVDIGLSGGADAIRQALRAGVVDELIFHLAPVVLGQGLRLFEDATLQSLVLEPVEVAGSAKATHLKYRLGKWPGEADSSNDNCTE